MKKRYATTLGIAAVLSSAIVAAPAWAQGAVSGELRDLKGSVMVLKGKDYVNGTNGMALVSGDRVLALEKSQAKVLINTGGQRCEIDLRENQALTVTATDCKALIAAVQTVPGAGAPGSAAIVGGTTAAAVGTTAAAGGAGVGGAVLWIGGTMAIAGGIAGLTREKASGD
jgi:hypothetical protein